MESRKLTKAEIEQFTPETGFASEADTFYVECNDCKKYPHPNCGDMADILAQLHPRPCLIPIRYVGASEVKKK